MAGQGNVLLAPNFGQILQLHRPSKNIIRARCRPCCHQKPNPFLHRWPWQLYSPETSSLIADQPAHRREKPCFGSCRCYFAFIFLYSSLTPTWVMSSPVEMGYHLIQHCLYTDIYWSLFLFSGCSEAECLSKRSSIPFGRLQSPLSTAVPLECYPLASFSQLIWSRFASSSVILAVL